MPNLARFPGDVELRHIQASNAAFAALRGDGTVVTWGDDGWGADSRAVSSQLVRVQAIQAAMAAFAAIGEDGSVAPWFAFPLDVSLGL